MKSLLFCITRTSILRASMARRTSDQRRSSSFVEMGVLRRSFASLMVIYSLRSGGLVPAFHDIDHMLALAGKETAQILLDDRQAAVGVLVVEAAQMRRDHHVRHR